MPRVNAQKRFPATMHDLANDQPNEPSGGGGHRRHRSTRRRVVTAIACATAGVVLIAGAGGGYLLWRLNSNIKTVDLSALGDRPADSDTGAMNILLLGSDSRSGSNGELAGGTDDGTARSDTAMVIHVNAAHTHADVVSIPRDTLVDRPSCTTSSGGTVAAASDVMFNTAYSVGGATCAVKTVESMTGLRMDHYFEVDFSGFAKLVTALGGVTVTTTVNIDDVDSGLHLAAGTHHLTGDEALAFVRTRHGVGDGSDLGRIELEQQMMTSLLSQAENIDLLSSPTKLYDLASTATSALTTDSSLGSVTSLVSFASSLKDIDSKSITSVTMPTQTAPSDPNRLVTLDPQATQLWTALKDDASIPESVLKLQIANPADSTKTSAGVTAGAAE